MTAEEKIKESKKRYFKGYHYDYSEGRHYCDTCKASSVNQDTLVVHIRRTHRPNG